MNLNGCDSPLLITRPVSSGLNTRPVEQERRIKGRVAGEILIKALNASCLANTHGSMFCLGDILRNAVDPETLKGAMLPENRGRQPFGENPICQIFLM